MLGKTWGISPKITMWLYTAIIRPTITYGAIVWWTRTELSTVITRLQRFQRMACSAITGCMRTTPGAALDTILNLTPLDLYIQQEATMSALRLHNLGLWGATSSPHAQIMDRAIAHEPLIAAPCDRMPSRPIQNKHYQIQLYEDIKDESGTHEVRIYTDGSKTDTGTGAGVHSMDLNISISITLGCYSSIFQCECVAITQAATAVQKRGINDQCIRILSDSAAILGALEGNNCNSKLVYECHLALERISTYNRVILQWIKGHSGSLGNDAADELARRGSGTTTEGPPPFLPLPFSLLQSWTRLRTRETHNERWKSLPECRQAREALPSTAPKLTKRLLNLSRKDLRVLVGTLTGHCPLNKHLFTIGATDSPLCRGCLSDDETAAHVILECEGVTAQRTEILNLPRSLREACEDPRKILRFWTELGWLC